MNLIISITEDNWLWMVGENDHLPSDSSNFTVRILRSLFAAEAKQSTLAKEGRVDHSPPAMEFLKVLSHSYDPHKS